MEEYNQLIQGYIEDVTINIQEGNNNDSNVSEFKDREYQCGCLGGGILKMLSYFKLINKYYNLRNGSFAVNANKNNNQNNFLDPENIEKLNTEDVTIVEDNVPNSRVQKSFCTINFSF